MEENSHLPLTIIRNLGFTLIPPQDLKNHWGSGTYFSTFQNLSFK